MTQETGLRGPASVAESRELLDLLVAVQEKLQLYAAGIYTQSSRFNPSRLDARRNQGLGSIYGPA